MKRITVAYWHLHEYKEIGIPHVTEYDYSTEKRTELINHILDKGFNVMTQQTKENIIIWIDNKRFGQG